MALRRKTTEKATFENVIILKKICGTSKNLQDRSKYSNIVAVCSTSQDPWLCLHCGMVNCGRYIKGHAKDHFEQHNNHMVCIQCVNLAVYCYTCDEFVVNDTQCGLLERVRQDWFQSVDSNPSEDNDCSVADDDDQGFWKSDSLTKEIQENVRTLRPRSRKRSRSAYSSSMENRRYERQHVGKLKNSNPKLREKKVVGLRNLGNTCFMNAVLQSLSNIEEFCYYFKQLPSLENAKNNGRKVYQSRSLREMNDALMAEELRKILISLTQGGSKGAISPESLFLVIWKIVPRFRGYQQQDAHEFLRYMLDRLHTELLHLLPDFTLKDNPYISLGHKSRSSIVTSVFGGTLQSEVRCLNCSSESKKHDPFLDLSLDIPEKFQLLKKTKDSEDLPPPCNLADCLTSFIEVEELAETELYYCNNCKSKQRSTKRFWIRRLPNVLCLHLKRFRWHNSLRTKIDTNISFPVTALDMSQFVLSSLHETRRSGMGSNLYDLAAVIVHHGSGVGSGHYTAFAVNDGQWFHFNDSTVRLTEDEVVAKCKPYIMFYIRREFRLPHLSS
ncbi:ubiquitin carboxyl-terminal hydrolase 3-like isoform X4 [Zootermopsis nevadensis]|uniref:ubiquitin carboxyl-terminal hydrolase 3-like isoform X4 n=1 Tax=Zootermopsis nevadensis TaxID=136037 RepID=UPI000B8EA105|nr:ubiquitin carboxyl-terminal hydrolase 3-like isoform X4 [Zootermopsis nevadensis]